MIRFFLGALAGAAVVFAITYSAGPDPVRIERDGASAAQAAPLRASDDAVPGSVADPSGNTRDKAAPAPFPDGEFTLRIGEGYRFGEKSVRAADDSDADLFCQDLRNDASLRCEHGAAAADLPIGAVSVPKSAADLAAKIHDAPASIGQRDAKLTLRPGKQTSGVALVLAHDGTAYCIHVIKLTGAPEALKRTVTIGYKRVPIREGGGVADLPVAKGAPSITREDVKRYVRIASNIPGSSFGNFINGTYRTLQSSERVLELNDQAYIAVNEPFARKITFNRRGALLAAAGVAPEGHIVTKSYSGLISIGDMAGTVDVKSYSHLHVTGNLTGVVNVGSYATLIVDGDILGTLNVKSYMTLLLRGRVSGTINTKGSCWSTLYFQSYHSRAELEQLGDGFRQFTLHVKQSDLPRGEKHKKIGSWRAVIVDDEKAWKRILKVK
ncbi:MAG: hypothetical protein V3T86_08255 [Planctomycetota bacterium]